MVGGKERIFNSADVTLEWRQERPEAGDAC